MSSLTEPEKRYFEDLLNMRGGYVLDYSDATFAEFFSRYGVDIHNPKYCRYGTSKAKKLRAFWELESDSLVGRVLSELLDSYEVHCKLKGDTPDREKLATCRSIVARLCGGKPPKCGTEIFDDFLKQEFSIPNVHKLPVESQVASIVERRLDEVRRAMHAGAYLAAIILCGSILEAVLLGAALRNPEHFNRGSESPKTPEGKPKPFQEWSLARLIDVACEIGLLKLDVKKFSHVLREFRNFIHPYQQLASGFTPDEQTAKICFQVLKAALADLAGER